MLIAMFVCVFVLGLYLLPRWGFDVVWVTLIAWSAVGLLAWPLSLIAETSKIQSFKSVQQTLQQQRDGGDGIEGAGFRLKIADQNAWLAKAQFWNDTLFDPYIPDEVDELQPIK